MKLFLHEHAKAALNRAIFIGGNARSGTTILGKIVHSMDDVEYAFEPPYLFTLLPLIQQIPQNHFEAMFEAYCYEDILLGAIAGRNLNFNDNDDSCIHKVKSPAEVAKRLAKPWTKNDQVAAAKSAVLCLKMPDTAAPLVSLQKYYPGLKIVTTHRKANPVIDSIMRKHWFSDQNLSERTLIWPSQRKEGLLIPVWVEEEKLENWLRWTELERTAYYYLKITTGLKQVPNTIQFSYEKMIENPRGQVQKLADRLGLKFGPKTLEIIGTIEKKSPDSDDWVGKLSSDLQFQIKEAEELPIDV